MAELGYYVVPSDEELGGGYILLNDIYVDHHNTRSKRKEPSERVETKQYFQGTLLREVKTDRSVGDGRVLCKNSETNDIFNCPEKDLAALSDGVYQLLVAMSSCRARFEVYREKDRLADGLEMVVGDEVFVRIPNQSGEILGVIRYKGMMRDKEGTHFGVELFNADGIGNSNGTVGKTRYFDCGTDCGVFVPLNRITIARNSSHRTMSPRSGARRNKASRHQAVSQSPETCPFTLNISKEELSKLPIKHGAEVYIFTEVDGQESQEKGKVVFIGRLPGNHNREIYVGIDLDRAVGNGTGLYSGKHLFHTKQNHAALVPLSGVLPANLAETHTSPESNHSYEDRFGAEPSTSTKKYRRNPNSSPSHRYHRNGRPVLDQRRTSHSSPSVIGAGPDDWHRSSKKTVMPMSTNDLYRATSGTIMARDGHGYVRDSDRHRSITQDNSDLSDNDVDIYSSGTSHDKMPGKSTRPRENVTVPDIRASPMVSIPRRKVHTIPDVRAYSGKLAQVVPMETITKLEFPDVDLKEIHDMEIGTMVEVPSTAVGSLNNTGPVYGVIKWIGKLEEEGETAAGIELESTIPNGNDGWYDGVQYFSCEAGKGQFVFLKFCRKDPRFSNPDFAFSVAHSPLPTDFGSMESPVVQENVHPPMRLASDMVGLKRGIQGHHNSCYLDSTLFSLFAYSQVLDTVLFRPRKRGDLPEYDEAQQLLRESIINPLRKHHFVRADKIMQLRKLLDKLGSTSGLVNEEKDPEEFLNTLLHQVFKAEPLHELRQGDSNSAHEGFFYQIFMERDEKFKCPSTQQLLEKSLISADLKFRNAPVCLILQMPRFGKEYKMYKRLKPTLQLDISNLVEEIPRACDVCESLAEYECRDCYVESNMDETKYSFCAVCAKRIHKHRKRANHKYKAIKVPEGYKEMYQRLEETQGDQPAIQPHTMELFAVVCIATSHYVSFAKCGYGRDASWVFFDSMADRVGEQNGYNIPQITRCPDVEKWLNLDESEILEEDEKLMPELKRRLLCDSYMCMYQSLELMVNK